MMLQGKEELQTTIFGSWPNYSWEAKIAVPSFFPRARGGVNAMKFYYRHNV